MIVLRFFLFGEEVIVWRRFLGGRGDSVNIKIGRIDGRYLRDCYGCVIYFKDG